MLDWVIVFFVLAVVAGLLGFSGVQHAAMDIARILFYIFLVLFVAVLLMRLFGGTPLIVM